MYLPYKRVALTDKQIKKRYSKFVKKYKKYLQCKDEFFIKLFFSIMIMEDYNRPWYLRILEYLLFIYKSIRYKRGCMTLGIMQTKTNYLISNLTSIKLAEHLIDCMLKQINDINENDKIRKVTFIYNPSRLYYNEVIKIYNII